MWSNSLTDTSKASKSQSTHLSSWPASLFSADPWNSSQSQVYQWNSPITCHSPSIWMTKMALVSLLEIFPKLNFKKHLCSYFESVHLDIFPWKWKLLSHVWLFATPYGPWDSPGQNTGVGSHSLFQGIFPIQGSNPGLLHYKWILLLSEPPGKPKNTGVGSLSLLQGIFQTQESNQGLLHWRQILYQLSYQRSCLINKLK